MLCYCLILNCNDCLILFIIYILSYYMSLYLTCLKFNSWIRKNGIDPDIGSTYYKFRLKVKHL